MRHCCRRNRGKQIDSGERASECVDEKLHEKGGERTGSGKNAPTLSGRGRIVRFSEALFIGSRTGNDALW